MTTFNKVILCYSGSKELPSKYFSNSNLRVLNKTVFVPADYLRIQADYDTLASCSVRVGTEV